MKLIILELILLLFKVSCGGISNQCNQEKDCPKYYYCAKHMMGNL